MSKILIKSLKIFAIIIVSIIALMFIIPLAFKGKIIKVANEQANNNLNAVVKFSDISLSLFRDFPNLSIRIKEISIVGKDTFATDTLFDSKYVDLGVNLMSVISGNEIKLKTIALIQPKIKVIFLENGKTNYDITISDTTATTPETPVETEEAPMKINLKKVIIEKGNIIYDDKSLAMVADIQNMNLELKGDIVGDLSNLDLKTVIEKLTVDYDGVRYLSKVKVDYKANIISDLKNWKFSFAENNLTMNELAMSFDGFVEMPDTNIYSDIKFSASKNDFKAVLSLIPAVYAKDFEGVKTSGIFSMTGYVKGNYNDYSMPAFGIDLIVENARFQYPDLPKSVENINIKMKVDAEEGTGDNMIIDIKKAHFEIAKNPIDIIFYAKMTLADIDMNGKIAGKIDFNSIADVIPLDEGMSVKGIAQADIKFKGKMSDIDNGNYDKFYAEGNLNLSKFEYISPDMPKFIINTADMFFSPQFVDLKTFDAKTPKSDFQLNGKIYNVFAYVFKNELLKADFNFSSNNIDVDEFMGESTSSTTTETDKTATETASSEPIQIPENIDFTLNSNLKKVKYDNLEITNIKGKIIAKNGIAKLEKIFMELLGGSTEMNGSYTAVNKSEPKADFSLLFKNFDIPTLYKSFVTIKKFTPIAEYCSGKINGNISLQTVLDNEMMPVYNTLDSKGTFSSDNIGIKNNKIFNAIADKTKYKEFADPVLKDVEISYTMDDGNITIKPTNFKIAGIKTTFGGNQKIDGAIDYKTDLELPSKFAANVLSKIPGDSPANISVSVKIGGTVDNPKITGFGSNLTDNLKDKTLDVIEKYTGVDKEKAKEILESAQKKADALILEAKNQADKIRKEADNAGKLLISEAKKQGDKLISQATNPITKKAAQLTADKLVKEAEDKAKALNVEADKKATQLTDKAKLEADKIIESANQQVEKL